MPINHQYLVLAKKSGQLVHSSLNGWVPRMFILCFSMSCQGITADVTNHKSVEEYSIGLSRSMVTALSGFCSKDLHLVKSPLMAFMN